MSTSGRVTLAEVARKAGVSKTTASVVLNGGGEALGIREATRTLVLDAANNLGYTPNYAARMLRRGSTRIITMLVQALANPFFVDMAVVARGFAAAGGYELEVVDAGRLEDEVTALEHLRSGRADGVIVATGRHYIRRPAVDRLIELVDRGTPAVVLIDQSPDPRVPAIRPDVYGGSLTAMRHLIALGHRRIAHVALPGDDDLATVPTSQGDRYRAYRDAHVEVGIDLDPSYLVRGPDTLAGGQESMRRVLALEPRPTAAFVYNDVTSVGALRACVDAGVRVPEDLALISFDGIDLGAFVSPALTTVYNPGKEMAEQAITTLFGMLNGQPAGPIDTVLPTRLVIRESA